MEKIFIPTLHTFAMDNVFTGSCGTFRFRIQPQVVKKNSKEVDMEASSITAEYWHGQLCYEKSTVEDKKDFPMSLDGREEMRLWLESNI